MRLIVFVVVFAIVFISVSWAYARVTAVSFDGYRAKTSALNCKLAKHRTDRPVIFIPGLKGSVLSKNGTVLWLTASRALKNTEPLTFEDGDGIEATGLLTRIALFEPYQKIATQMACNEHGYVFWYDWRNPAGATDNLADLIDRIIRETGHKPSIVAHSMGGLVAHTVLKERPDTIEKVVYVSVPFQPGVGYFDDVHMGTRVGLNRSIMSKQALITQPASFVAMPHFGSGRYAGVELLDAKTWEDHRFGVYAESGYDTASLQKVMDRAKLFHEQLDAPMKLSHDVLIVTGNCKQTVMTIGENGERSYAPGDGRVSRESAVPFDELPNMRRADFCVKHDKQMADQEILRTVFGFLQTKDGALQTESSN